MPTINYSCAIFIVVSLAGSISTVNCQDCSNPLYNIETWKVADHSIPTETSFNGDIETLSALNKECMEIYNGRMLLMNSQMYGSTCSTQWQEVVDFPTCVPYGCTDEEGAQAWSNFDTNEASYFGTDCTVLYSVTGDFCTNSLYSDLCEETSSNSGSSISLLIIICIVVGASIGSLCLWYVLFSIYYFNCMKETNFKNVPKASCVIVNENVKDLEPENGENPQSMTTIRKSLTARPYKPTFSPKSSVPVHSPSISNVEDGIAVEVCVKAPKPELSFPQKLDLWELEDQKSLGILNENEYQEKKNALLDNNATGN